jgi:putative intracellular protease/amidase
VDGLRQFRGAVRRRLRRPEDPAVLDRGRGEQARGHEFIVNARFKPHAIRDGNLITGQQQYSGRVAARQMIEALGI